MLKKSVLTPVLSGVLAVTVVGSGVGYYNVFVKDGDAKTDAKKKDEKTSKSVVITADEAAKSIEETIGKAVQLANGELDAGYKASVTYTMPNSDLGVQNISFDLEAKQKDKMSSADYSLNCDGKSAISMNLVYDNENEQVYLKIPELSDAYLVDNAENIGSMADGLSITANPVDVAGGDEILNELNDYDFSALFDDLATYVDTIKENGPQATDGEKYTISKDGVSIDLDTKSYKITAKDAKKVADAIASKGKSDAVLKDFFTKACGEAVDYDSMWDDLTDIDESDTSAIEIDVYYDGDNFAGLYGRSDDGGNFRFVAASTETDILVEGGSVDGDDTMVIDGHITFKDDTLDGKVSMEMVEYGYKTGFTMEYKSVTVTDDAAKGEIVYNATQDGQESMNLSINLNCSGNDVDITMSASAQGEAVGTVSIKAQETNASDITVPTGTFYKLSDENELQQYLEGCDMDGWMNSLKDVIGEDMYNAFFSVQNFGYDDYDFDDYNFDDYDFGDDDLGLHIEDFEVDLSDFEYADSAV